MYNSSGLPDLQFIPIQEADLPIINGFSNNPKLSEHFETIPPVSMESTYTFWRYILHGIASLWGIHLEGKIIGCAGFFNQPPGTRLSHSATFFLFIEPDHWGRGIGTEAMAFLEQVISGRGYLRMECMVTGTNLRAIRLYERSGFIREGLKKQAYLVDGQYVDLVIMGKVFSPNN